ncbi:phosphatase 2C-like domain-containing protein, partial [Mycena sp. CBHHK59/15]
QDRTVIHQFDHGTIIAIFDGHCGDELSQFTAERLPAGIAHRLTKGVDVGAVLKGTIEQFDESLLWPIFDLFEDDDRSDPWLNAEEKLWPLLSSDNSNTEHGDVDVRAIFRRAVVGSTALIAFLDASRENLWVASLGDSDAVCARRHESGEWTQTFLSERHNCSNPAEVERINREHPGEAHAIVDVAVLDALRVTRSLGDHQLKAPFSMASRVLQYFPPRHILPDNFKKWKPYTPPYISSTPAIRHHAVAPGDLLLFASDGLRDVLPVSDTERFPILIALANGEVDARLGHECIPVRSDDNVAERVIKNALFGTDADKRNHELDHETFRDDISLVILRFE